MPFHLKFATSQTHIQLLRKFIFFWPCLRCDDNAYRMAGHETETIRNGKHTSATNTSSMHHAVFALAHYRLSPCGFLQFLSATMCLKLTATIIFSFLPIVVRFTDIDGIHLFALFACLLTSNISNEFHLFYFVIFFCL